MSYFEINRRYMQFTRNTSTSKLRGTLMLITKIALSFLVIFIIVFLLNKIDFPSPNKKIEKIIPNEKLKIVK